MRHQTIFDQQIQVAGASFGASQQVSTASSINLSQYLAALEIEVMFRVTIGTAAATAVLPEAPYSLIRRLQVAVNHKIYGALNVVNLPAATLQQIQALFNKVTANVQGTVLGTAVGNYDVDMHLTIPFSLENVVDFQQANTLLDAPRATSIMVSATLGTADDLFTPGGTTTFTFSGYGGAGNPVINVSRVIAPGYAATQPLTNLVVRTDRVDSLTQNVTPGSPNAQQLQVGNLYRLIGVKQYIQNGTSPDTVQSFLNPIASSDSGLERFQLFLNGIAVQDFYTWQAFVNKTRATYGIAPGTGYAVLDFLTTGMQRPGYMFNTRTVAQNNGTLAYGGLINGVAGGTAEIFSVQVMPNPSIPRK